MDIRLGNELHQSALERHWNRKLTPTLENPFPLAPKDLVRSGKVCQMTYELENERFSNFCSSIMEREILDLANQPTFKDMIPPRIDILGGGIGRGLEWILEAVTKGFYVKVYDISRVACENIEAKFSHYRLEVVQEEITTGWNNDEVVVYFASQFVQVQKTLRMLRLMRHFGGLLNQSFYGFRPRLYLVHPFEKNNQDVLWGDTTPYSEEELLGALVGKKGKSLMKIELLGVHSYFHQKYSLLKIESKG